MRAAVATPESLSSECGTCRTWLSYMCHIRFFDCLICATFGALTVFYVPYSVPRLYYMYQIRYLAEAVADTGGGGHAKVAHGQKALQRLQPFVFVYQYTW